MRFRPAASATALLVATALTPVSTAGAADVVTWAPADFAAIHPGVQTVLESSGAQCTGNFIYRDKAGGVYLGQASHCTSEAGELSGSGCATTSSPLGTEVTVGDTGVKGTLAYSSWLTMQKLGEKDDATCFNNDFALVKLPATAVSQVNPSEPVFGGPVGVATGELPEGTPVEGIGSSGLRGGYNVLSAQRGLIIVSDPSGWYYEAYLVPPGVPGDSGGGYLDDQGRAFGVLVSVNTVPPGSNTMIDLGRALAYAQAHSGIKGLELVPGTESFSG